MTPTSLERKSRPYCAGLVLILLITLLVALVLLALLCGPVVATYYASQDDRGGGDLQGLGVEVLYLPDPAGPTFWVYIADYMACPLEGERPEDASPDLVPVEGPQPVETPEPPTPAPLMPSPYRRPMELKQG